MLSKKEIIKLLELDENSKEVIALRKEARAITKKVTKNTGRIWAAIGLDYASCRMSCDFCSLGEKYNSTEKHYELTQREVLNIANSFVNQGIDWLVLRSTEFYPLGKLIDYAHLIKDNLSGNFTLTVNTGNDNTLRADELKKSGYEMVYQAIRLREGIDTKFDLKERKRAIKKVTESEMILSQYLEPLGPEHTNEEIADRIIDIVKEKTKVSGLMIRVPVKGTPKYKLGSLSDNRIAQITAILRISTKDHIKDLVIHPKVDSALESGANALVVDIGAIPRSNEVHLEEWDGQDVKKAKKALKEKGYDI
ncbi:hypothetical protein KQI18_11285 [Clostridioides mangenotii]|uniref:radical SAM protein n=1 Tax=Metaclostridioides mangenotii TaxID=1540 RepID=UPI001C0F863A|nr:radical SAM protein [Clostridioides mangenotii]MBU5308361.1 hypothetical protein [Clostridioides mangenotii]